MRSIMHLGAILVVFLPLFAGRAPEAAASPQLFKVGTTPEGGRITFANITRPDAMRSVLFGAMPNSMVTVTWTRTTAACSTVV